MSDSLTQQDGPFEYYPRTPGGASSVSGDSDGDETTAATQGSSYSEPSKGKI